MSRRRFLAKAAAGLGAVAAGSAVVRAIRLDGQVPAELRPLGTAAATRVDPYVQALPGLSGFHRRIAEIGATSELTWHGPPARPDETAVLLAGFDPTGASFRGDAVILKGAEDPVLIRVFALDRRALTGRSPVTLRLLDATSGRTLASSAVTLAD